MLEIFKDYIKNGGIEFNQNEIIILNYDIDQKMYVEELIEYRIDQLGQSYILDLLNFLEFEDFDNYNDFLNYITGDFPDIKDFFNYCTTYTDGDGDKFLILEKSKWDIYPPDWEI